MSRDRVVQLQERAEELGFSTITEALDAGYHEVQDLVAGTFTLEKIDEQEKAHEAWLEEKRKILNELNSILNAINGQAYNNFSDYELLTFIKNNKQIIAKTIEFIEKGEM